VGQAVGCGVGYRAATLGKRPIDLEDGRDGVCLRGRLVGPIPLDPREAKGDAAWILWARLDFVERDLRDDLRSDVDRVIVAADLELQELLRLPGEHLVRQSLERLAEHDESAAQGIACAQMEVAERAAAPTASPLGSEDDEVERPRLLDLQPRRTA